MAQSSNTFGRAEYTVLRKEFNLVCWVFNSSNLGTWAGPNTVAQALRCRAKADPVFNIVVHVAMDMLVIKQNIKRECLKPAIRLADTQVEVEPLFTPIVTSKTDPIG